METNGNKYVKTQGSFNWRGGIYLGFSTKADKTENRKEIRRPGKYSKNDLHV